MSKSSRDSRWLARCAAFVPLIWSSFLLAVLLFYLYAAVIKSCGGQFGYPMDDTYIHMAMARAFSQHGVWGLTRYAFSSTSSSLLYTFVLSAVYFVVGINQIAPLLLNVLFAFLLLFVCDFVLKRGGVPAFPRLLSLTLIVFATPLAPETMAGMEHLLHAVLTILLVFCSVRLLVDGSRSAGLMYAVPALAALTVLARYEAMALVFVIAVLFFTHGKRFYALALLAAAGFPIALFGAYSMAQGWFPVPNSIIAKASRPEKSRLAYPIHWAEQLWATPAVACLVVAGAVLLLLLYRRRKTLWTADCLTLAIFLPTAILHMQFARVGWFYRYEAYLVVFGIYACTLGMRGLAGARHSAFAYYALFLSIAAVCSYPRAIGSLWLTPWACRNIHEQQYQMGRFLEQNDSGVGVVLNDIGAAGFLSDARIVDLYGLATVEVARAKMHHAFTRDFRAALAAQTDSKIAIVYPAMFRDVGGLPSGWIPVGSWRIRENQICWGDTVTFYAIDPAYRSKLIADLRQFGAKLPGDVVQAGLYKNGQK